MTEKNTEKKTLTVNLPKGERIAKVMARAGLCSRREAERWILADRVQINGKILKECGTKITAKDTVLVDNKPLPMAEPTRLWRYHKPAGLVNTNNDEKGRRTIFDAMPPEMPRVISIGRLDLNSEGLLLLTNDGELARHLELPATGWKRRYRIRVHGRVNEKKLASLAGGCEVDGVKYGAIDANLESTKGANSWISVTLREGKNREIRNVMEALDLHVNRLIRVGYGPFQLGTMVRGAVDEIPTSALKSAVGRYMPQKNNQKPQDKSKWAKKKSQRQNNKTHKNKGKK